MLSQRRILLQAATVLGLGITNNLGTKPAVAAAFVETCHICYDSNICQSLSTLKADCDQECPNRNDWIAQQGCTLASSFCQEHFPTWHPSAYQKCLNPL